MKKVLLLLISILTSVVYAQNEFDTTSLYAVPLLGLFVTGMIVLIVWLMYKDKFTQLE